MPEQPMPTVTRNRDDDEEDLDQVAKEVAAEAAEQRERRVTVDPDADGAKAQAEAADRLRAYIEANNPHIQDRVQPDRPVDTRMEVDEYIWFHVPLTRREVVAICQQQAGASTAATATQEDIRQIVINCLHAGIPQSVSLDAWQARIEQLVP